MEIGIVILPQPRWAEAAPLWRRAEEYGFDSAWTYDHLAWRSLADEPWFATVPLLAAAAAVTSRIRLGTFVASPNYRHPVPFAKDVLGLDDISQGRFVLGVGAGGTGLDATVLGGEDLSPARRHARFAEFVELLDALLRQPTTTWRGEFYEAVAARMIPGPVAGRPPFVVAADGPRAMRLAARLGDGWVTLGTPGAGDREQWWQGVAAAAARFDAALAEVGRPAGEVARHVNLDAPDLPGGYSMSSAATFAEAVDRARDLGFDGVVAHWPRADGAYSGSEAVLEEVAGRLDELRAV